MSFKTASAILRGDWLIEPSYARNLLPLLKGMIKGTSTADQTSIKEKELRTDQILSPSKKYINGSKNNIYSVNPTTAIERVPNNSIAVIDLLGPILKYGDFCSYGSVEFNDLIIRLSNSDQVKGILLNIDSPGSQSDGTGMLAETIRQVSKIKPVITVIQDGIAASGAMWIGCAAQEIYCTRVTDQVGSIGAYCTIYDFAGFFEQNGIKVHNIYAPQSIDKNKDYKEAVKGNYTLMQADLKFLVKDFIDQVSFFRGQRLKVNGNEPFTGKMYYAKDALKIGLIDGIKPISEVIKRMENLIKLRT